MIRRILIPPVNEHRFITYDDVIAGTRYNQHQFDREWFELLIRDWQDHVYYDQKRQRKDRCSIQISATVNSTCTLKLYKCTRELVDSYSMSPILDSQGNNLVWYNEGNPYNAYQFIDNLFWQNEDLTDGRYYFIIEVVNGSDTDKIISEPISLVDEHPGTVLVEYTNSFNKDLCIFEQGRQKFSMRVEGDVMNFQPQVERVSFLDHEYNTTELSATTFRGWTVYLGNVPDYILDIQNYVWGLTSKRVEGKGYVAADGAAWVKESTEGSALCNGSLEVRESNIQDAYTITKGSIVLCDVGSIIEFVIMNVSVGKDGIADYYYENTTYIADGTAFDAFVTLLNSQATVQGVDGTFTRDGGKLLYELGSNETFDEGSAPVLTKYVSINSTSLASGNNLNVVVSIIPTQFGSSAYAFIGTSGATESAGHISGASPLVILSPTVVFSAATFSHKLFHDDTFIQLEIKGDYLVDFANSKFPESLLWFKLQNSPRITSFQIFNTLMHCAAKLTYLTITNNTLLANISNYSDYSIGTLSGNSMKALQYIDLRANRQSSNNLNALYNSMKASMQTLPTSDFVVHNGIINTSGQVPLAQPTNFPATGNSSQARSMLINTYGWIVII